MKNSIKVLIYLFILNLSFFYILQLFFTSTLVFEKITLSSAFLILLLIIIKKINYKKLSMILLIYICFILFFVNIDRSKSFHVLYWIEKYEFIYNPINSTFLENAPQLKNRINESEVSQRINEHQIRGLVTNDKNHIKLTGAGKAVLKISQLSAKYFRLSGWVGN